MIIEGEKETKDGSLKRSRNEEENGMGNPIKAIDVYKQALRHEIVSEHAMCVFRFIDELIRTRSVEQKIIEAGNMKERHVHVSILSHKRDWIAEDITEIITRYSKVLGLAVGQTNGKIFERGYLGLIRACNEHGLSSCTYTYNYHRCTTANGEYDHGIMFVFAPNEETK